MFKWKNKNGFKYLEIDKFRENGCNAYFTSRNGGVSKAPYKSLNLGLHTNDKNEKVIKNRKITANKLNLNFSSFTSAEQVHGDRVYVVEKKDKGRGNINYSDSIKKTDALITNVNGITLFSYYADCVPLYFYDRENKIIGLAHSGWKGTLKRIGLKVIEKMKNEFNSKVSDCLVAIGPAISKDFYEIDSNLAIKFKNNFSNIDNYLIYKSKNRYLLDLPGIIKMMFIKRGIKKGNLINSKMCTYSNKENFYSYRRDGGVTGRMASIITL